VFDTDFELYAFPLPPEEGAFTIVEYDGCTQAGFAALVDKLKQLLGPGGRFLGGA